MTIALLTLVLLCQVTAVVGSLYLTLVKKDKTKRWKLRQAQRIWTLEDGLGMGRSEAFGVSPPMSPLDAAITEARVTASWSLKAIEAQQEAKGLLPKGLFRQTYRGGGGHCHGLSMPIGSQLTTERDRETGAPMTVAQVKYRDSHGARDE